MHNSYLRKSNNSIKFSHMENQRFSQTVLSNIKDKTTSKKILNNSEMELLPL